MDKRSSNLGKHTGRTHGETWDNLKKTTKTSSMHNFFSGKKAHKQSKHVYVEATFCSPIVQYL